MLTLPQKSCAETPYFSSRNDEIWPRGALHSTDHETELLDFLEKLILDLVKSHPAVTHHVVAVWLARVVEGTPTTGSDELHAP